MASKEAIEIEGYIAMRFGSEENGQGFTVEELEPFIDKLRAFRDEQQQKNTKKIELAMAKRQKPSLVCRNQTCQNSDEAEFERDEKHAQITCKRCGTVVAERLIQDKDWTRQFDDDNDNPSNYGKPPDVRFSSARNLRTGMVAQPGQKARLRELQMAKDEVEINASRNAGVTKAKHTRDGYKDNVKARVFELMQEYGDARQLNDTILNLAKDIFAEYRDSVERLVNSNRIAAACLILAFRERLAQEGMSVFMNKQQKAAAAAAVAADDSKEFICKYCQMSFNTAQDRRFHIRKCDQKPKDESGATS